MASVVRNWRIDPILWFSRYAVLGIERANEIERYRWSEREGG